MSIRWFFVCFILPFVIGCSSLPTAEEMNPMSENNQTSSTPVEKPLNVPLLEEVDPLRWTFDRVDLNGTTLEYATLLPPDYKPEETYPLLLALPPGGQDRNMVEAGLSSFWQRGALYGFVIVSPVKPSGTNFMGDGSAVLPDFVTYLHSQYKIDGGKPHLGGVSNGGISTFKAGLERPDLYQSLTVSPGYAASGSDVSSLKDLKVTLYVGENDGAWVTNSQRTYDSLIDSGHSNTVLEIFSGEGHIITPITGNGAGVVFERLLQN
ncbi:MAG: hypothetical protein AAF633_04155 [Chloroflexota bacterium]